MSIGYVELLIELLIVQQKGGNKGRNTFLVFPSGASFCSRPF